MTRVATRRPKYGNRKTVVDGITFDSAREAKRYGELLLLYKAGEIGEPALQPEFKIVVNGVEICKYRADFSYRVLDPPYHLRIVVEDVKGVRTPVYRLKKKLVEALYGIQIREV